MPEQVTANRRRTVQRTFSLARLVGRSRNRRLHPRSPEKPASAGRGRALLADLRRACLLLLKGACLLLVVTGSVAGGYLVYRQIMRTPTFHIRTILVKGTRQASDEEIRQLVKELRGQHILTADLGEARRAVLTHPWVKDAEVVRELPATVRIQLSEHRARALLLIGHLYLVSSEGRVFKRATLEEAHGLPVITGLTRLQYLNRPAKSARQIRRALQALDRYQQEVRPRLSEVHLEPDGNLTLHLRQGGVALRFGRELSDWRLAQADAVLAALGPEAARVRVVFLDGESRRDRVTVRMGGGY